MNATERALIELYLAENPPEVWDPSWHQYVAMVTGYLFWLVVALVVLFLIVNALSDGWLKAKRNADLLCDPDLHPAVVCTCVIQPVDYVKLTPPTRITNPKCAIHGAEYFRRNRTNTLSIVEMHRRDGA